ncbi:reverse transcriptase [Senna tora]|uniref:Reverse transcriptase n=1 Tax=Senna tora TaxID=362788 RepID=A0A834TNF0_9FABA|nr:reverse transcriptase [Senna tora]
MGVALTVKALKELCRKYKPLIVFLMETKCSGVKLEAIRRRNRLAFDNSYYVDAVGKSGGLAVWWKNDITLNFSFSSKNFIHVVVASTLIDTPSFLSLVYGPPEEMERRVAWDQLRSFSSKIQGSWLCVGDFNDVLFHSEKWGGKLKASRKVVNFQNLLSDCGLFDLEYNGSSFTWFNKRIGDAFVMEKLDRALGNVELLCDFPQAQVFVNEPVGSDHCALVTDLNFCDGKTPRSFKFELSWLTHADYKEVMKASWHKSKRMRFDFILELLRRLEDCKKGLTDWTMVRFHVDNGDLKGVKLARHGPILSHCFFADDALFFMNVGREDCEVLRKIINDYCAASGQEANLDKSCLFFSSNASSSIKDDSPGDLWVRVLKGSYFPNGEFLDAVKGHKASWAWSSILEGRRLLVEGLWWKVGNGASIVVWRDKWIPGLKGGKLSSPCPEELADLRVEDCISARRWDLSRLQAHISAMELKAILAIPLPVGERYDSLVWEDSKNGMYFVKSGYRLANSIFGQPLLEDPSCSFRPPSSLWKAIWGLKVVPKVKSFLWRACVGALPTSEALFKRKCASSPCCQVCGAEVETIEHALLLCSWVKGVWFSCPLALVVAACRVTRFDSWCSEFLGQNGNLDSSGKALSLMLAGNLSISRAAAEFSGTFSQVGVSGGVYPGPRSLIPDWWQLPPPDSLKVNSDGAFLEDSLEVGIGFVVRNSSGSLLRTCCDKVCASSSIMSEALAFKAAMGCLVEFPNIRLVFEMDCEVLFNCIVSQGKIECSWHCAPVISDICLAASSSQLCSFVLVRRQGNQAADWLAKCAVQGLGPLGRVRDPPPPLASILARDLDLAVKKGSPKEGIG